MDETNSEVTVTTLNRPEGDRTETVNGRAKTTAAWLRALADDIDPRKPVMRGGLAFDPTAGDL